jgi:hypothetical protein
MFAGFFAKIAAGFLWSKAKAVSGWSALSPKAKMIILGVIAAVVLFFAHQWYAGRQASKHYMDGYKQAQKDDAEELKNANARIAALSVEIATKEREGFNADVVHINARTDAVRMRGPGKAVCPGLPPAPGGSQPGSGPVAGGVDRVPYPEWQQLLAMPFDDTISFAKQCDINAAELRHWHSWYLKLVATWPKG